MAQKKAKKNKTPVPGSIAYTADRYEYYEKAVQCVETEIDMVDHTYQTLRGKNANLLREDFCGTGNTSCEWVRRRNTNKAIGIDLDQQVLDWGIKHKVGALSAAQQNNVALLNRNVLTAEVEPVDVIMAMNFSYQLFKTRDELRRYFKQAHAGLANHGIFFIDAYGGHESAMKIKEKTKYDDFVYYWDQKKYNPINAHMLCHIHFKFKDKSWLHQAFTYDWRMWTLPELQEILVEAGFSKVQIYWEGTDATSGEGNGEYFATDQGEDDPSWVVYVVSEK